jgi:hypothetical protein
MAGLAPVAESAPNSERERLNLYFDDPEIRTRLRRVVGIRGGSESGNAIWLLKRSLDWYEGLSREEREKL